jgi:hypothetical protein
MGTCHRFGQKAGEIALNLLITADTLNEQDSDDTRLGESERLLNIRKEIDRLILELKDSLTLNNDILSRIRKEYRSDYRYR